MAKRRLSISPAAALLGALLYCTASFSELAAILAPAIVHELGHIVALRLYGLRIRRITADLRGLCSSIPAFVRRSDMPFPRSRARPRVSDTPLPPRTIPGAAPTRC